MGRVFVYNRATMKPIYKTVVIKVSGESLASEEDQTILDKEKLASIAKMVSSITKLGVHVGLVVGAGNIWRGRLADTVGINQSTADYMGMLGTIINALALQSVFEEYGLETRVMSAINVPQVCEPYIRRKAMAHLERGVVTIFAGGTGNPFFTTDTTATLRALDIGADAILMGKNAVEGVYDDDPRKNPNAKLIKKLTFHEVVEKKLAVMDLTAVALLNDSPIKIHVFNIENTENFLRIILGEKIGSVIAKE